MGNELESLNSISSMENLKKKAFDCEWCSLRKGCLGVVFGEGDANTDLMFVGEAPGRSEDEQRRPFVGAAGQLLDKILTAADIDREEIYITNSVKCRPQENRFPQPEEQKACFPWLVRQVQLIEPKIIVCLGSLATKTILGPESKVTKMRGEVFRRKGINIIPTFHPAALLRDSRKKYPVWEDIQMIRDKYRALT